MSIHSHPRTHIPRLPACLPPKSRELVEKAIGMHIAATEALLAFLDAADGDIDLEDNGDREPDAEGESSLGWPLGLDQVRALRNHRISAEIGGVDAETEHDGREPILGAAETIYQGRWGNEGPRDDRERDAGDEAEAGADDDMSCEDVGACSNVEAI